MQPEGSTGQNAADLTTCLTGTKSKENDGVSQHGIINMSTNDSSSSQPSSSGLSSGANSTHKTEESQAYDGKRHIQIGAPTGSRRNSAGSRDDGDAKSKTRAVKEGDETHESENASSRKVTLSDFVRFATPANTAFNLVGLVAACAAGAAQPLMTIVSLP